MTTAKKVPDWPAIKAEYLAGTASIRVIAEQYCVSDTAIRKRATAEKWPARPAKVRKAAKQRTVRTKRVEPAERVVSAEPMAIADHGRGLISRMLDELDAVTTYHGEIEDLILVETENDEGNRRRDAMLGAISLGGRAKTLKELAAAFKTINEASAPQGKKAQAQDLAEEVASRFRPLGPPTLKSVK